jgi:SRSO17 transposase
MTRDEVRAAARRLTRWHRRFAHWFGRPEAQGHAQVYLRGLLSNLRRKNVEAIALRFAGDSHGAAVAEKEVVAMQGFITASPWQWGPLQAEIQAVFAETMVPSTSEWSLGVVGVIDESGFAKQGTESVGVARQYCGRLGKVANCQVGVFLVGVTPAGTGLLDHQLFLPEDWANDRQLRRKTHVPEEVTFQTKPQIAAEMIRRTAGAGHVHLSWIVGDALYGDSGKLLDALEATGQRYVLEVKANTLVWTEDPAGRTSIYKGPKRRAREGGWRQPGVRAVREIAAEVPEEAWQPIQLREGAKGPLVYEYTRLRGWAVRRGRTGPPIWIMLQRSLDHPGEVSYHVSNADETTLLEEMALAAGSRWRVEEFFHDAKRHLGMADYETRAWTSWHHHMSLVALAHLYVTLTKQELHRDVPELTLDMAVRVLQSGFARGELHEDAAADIIEYHLRRNRIARDSHRKSWLQKHKRTKLKVLL